MNSETAIVPIIRKFNRFYTKVLGLLDKHLLDSNFLFRRLGFSMKLVILRVHSQHAYRATTT